MRGSSSEWETAESNANFLLVLGSHVPLLRVLVTPPSYIPTEISVFTVSCVYLPESQLLDLLGSVKRQPLLL